MTVPITLHNHAEKAWVEHVATQAASGGRIRLTKREFIDGYLRGAKDEAARFKNHVIPTLSKLYDLVHALDEHPGLANELWLRSPETVKRVIAFLEGKANDN